MNLHTSEDRVKTWRKSCKGSKGRMGQSGICSLCLCVCLSISLESPPHRLLKFTP